MPRKKGWEYSEAMKENKNARRGKHDRRLTENSDTGRDVTEELASLKTENNDIVQGSVNLVSEPKKLLNNLPNKQSNDKTDNKETVSQRIQRVSWSSARTWNACHRIFGSFHQNDQRFPDESRGFLKFAKLQYVSLWLSMSGDYRVTDEALLAETL